MSNSQEEPSQINARLAQAQGAIYNAVGAVSTDPSWKSEGAALQEQGDKELAEAQAKAKGEAAGDRLVGKGESAWGMLTGDQDKMKEGNMKAEKAEWKSAAADGTMPSVSMERMQGKAESALGMLTGDADKQAEGNIKAEKAEWTKG